MHDRPVPDPSGRPRDTSPEVWRMMVEHWPPDGSVALRGVAGAVGLSDLLEQALAAAEASDSD